MSIGDWIKSFFGKGMIRAECVTTDGDEMTLKIPYIGNINTMNHKKFEMEMSNQLFVKYGKRISPGTLTILGFTKD